MSDHLSARWDECCDFQLIAALCEGQNRGKLFEILGEYAELGAEKVKQSSLKCWLYYENDKVSGFALARKMGAFNVLEEVWGPFDGVYGDQLDLTERDMERGQIFRSSVLHKLETPILLRGASDNHFAHGIARGLHLPWFNGVIIAERHLRRKVKLSVPKGFKLREFQAGDEEFLSGLHQAAFNETIPPEEFRRWVTDPRAKLFVATWSSVPVGFVIAEKRPYKSMGDFNIAVSPEYRLKGIGTCLLRAGLNALYEAGVRVAIADYRILNRATHSIYGKHNFTPMRTYNYFIIR